MPQYPLDLPPLNLRADTGLVTTSQGNYQINNVSVHLSTDKKVIVKGTCPGLGIQHDVLRFSLSFTTASGWTIDIPNCMINIITRPGGVIEEALASKASAHQGILKDTDQVEVVKVVADFPFEADLEIPIAGHPNRAIVTFSASTLNHVTLVKEPVVGLPSATGYFVFIDSVAAVDSTWKAIFHEDLYSLLSLASSNYVSFPITYLVGPNGKRLELLASVRETGRGVSVIPLDRRRVISRFLNSTFDHYQAMRQTLDLPMLIHYYVLLKNTSYRETRYLLGSVFMEGLKYAYATSHGYRKKGLKWVDPNGAQLDLRGVIKNVYSTYGIANGDENFVQYRNEVIHEGKLKLSLSDLLAKEDALEETIEHVLLKVLNYDGLYGDKATREFIEFRSIVV